MKPALWFYRNLISPALHFFAGPNSGCRFYPSCSHYAEQAWVDHGFFRGSCFALARILRCHPLSGRSGFDPVPAPRNKLHIAPRLKGNVIRNKKEFSL